MFPAPPPIWVSKSTHCDDTDFDIGIALVVSMGTEEVSRGLRKERVWRACAVSICLQSACRRVDGVLTPAVGVPVCAPNNNSYNLYTFD